MENELESLKICESESDCLQQINGLGEKHLYNTACSTKLYLKFVQVKFQLQ